jgi:hypothetical protein
VAGVILALIAIVCLVLFCGPLKKWRENREYEKMMERTYRPALDEPKHVHRLYSDPEPPMRETGGLGMHPPSIVGMPAAQADGAYRGMPPTNMSAGMTPPQRAYSFAADQPRGDPMASTADGGIKRKPLPTIGTGGASPALGAGTPTGGGGAEPWLPGKAR